MNGMHCQEGSPPRKLCQPRAVHEHYIYAVLKMVGFSLQDHVLFNDVSLENLDRKKIAVRLSIMIKHAFYNCIGIIGRV